MRQNVRHDAVCFSLCRVHVTRHRLPLVPLRWPARPWFQVLLSLVLGPPCRLPSKGEIWHPHPDQLNLWVWPLGQSGLTRNVHRGPGTLFLILMQHLLEDCTHVSGRCSVTCALFTVLICCIVQWVGFWILCNTIWIWVLHHSQ